MFAHPDDEALRCGGTLALNAARGAQVHLICLTRGEAGRNTDPALGDVDLPVQREHELHGACAALGIHPPIFLGHHDSGRGDRLRRDAPLATIHADLTRIRIGYGTDDRLPLEPSAGVQGPNNFAGPFLALL